jgi:hypothetical protein
MEIVRKFEREKKILQEKISAWWHRDWMKIIAFSIDKVSITLYTEGVLPIRIKWDGKTLDFITNN